MTDSPIKIDARGLTCPMPLMLLKKAITDLPAGSVIEVLVTDPHAELDFEIWCERFMHQISLVEVNDADEMIFKVIKCR